MSNPIKAFAAYTLDTLSFGPSRRSTARTVTASANRLSDLFKQTRNTIGQRRAVVRHETFQQAMERLEVDIEQLAHVHLHMTRMQRAAIISFSFVAVALGCWSGAMFVRPTLENIISTAISVALLASCYAFALIYGFRRFQIECRKFCSLGDYYRAAGFIHPLLW